MQLDHIQAVIFDLDGTLLDTLEDLAFSLNAALSEFHLPEHPLSAVRQFVGNGIDKLVERAIAGGRENPLFDAVLTRTREQYALHCEDKTAPYDGISELLQTLHSKGILLGVVSNKPDAQVKTLCASHFGECIGAAIGAVPGQALKPAPDAVREAMRQLSVSKENTVYIGDSEVDVATARNSGIPCISVLWGFRDRSELEAAGATLFAQNASQILQMFS